MRSQTEAVQTVVIGGGQAGLSAGYHLAQRGLPFVILDASDRIGDSWRNRWDSLRLFSPARYDGLDGMPFPGPGHAFPTKDQMADYLEAYAAKFQLPVRSRVKVNAVSRRSGRYLISAGAHRFEAEHVVVAMSKYQVPQVPRCALELDPSIVQIHSLDYRNPSQLRDGGVLVVGAGNSGADIALELSRYHRTWLAGRSTGHIPYRIEGLAARLFLQQFMLRFVFHRLLTNSTPIGRKARPKMISQGGPLIRVKPQDLKAAGVERVSRLAGARQGLPVLEDGTLLEVTNVIWSTGFRPGFSWINLPIFDEHGMPRHESGVVAQEPGLYFIGLPFIHSFSSAMIHGVGRDAKRIAGVIYERVSNAPPERRYEAQIGDRNELSTR